LLRRWRPTRLKSAVMPTGLDGMPEASEVVLKVESLDTATVLAMGGYSSDSKTLAGIVAQRDPTPEDIAWFEHYRRKAGIELGATWLEGARWERVLSRLEPRILELKDIKKAQEAARKA